jgi:hypothetical protein
MPRSAEKSVAGALAGTGFGRAREVIPSKALHTIRAITMTWVLACFIFSPSIKCLFNLLMHSNVMAIQSTS